jgi:hypothetical protein
MKKILFLLFIIVTGIFTYCDTVNHKCIDGSHAVCNDRCECYGKACPAPNLSDCKPYHYHVTLEDDSIIISDHGRHVASVPYEQIGVLDSIFVTDNE